MCTSACFEQLTDHTYHQQMVGARHIIQRQFIPNVDALRPPQDLKRSTADDRLAAMLRGDYAALDRMERENRVANSRALNPYANGRLYAMEFMKHGTFEVLAEKVAISNIRVNNGDLWRLFHCRKLFLFPAQFWRSRSNIRF